MLTDVIRAGRADVKHYLHVIPLEPLVFMGLWGATYRSPRPSKTPI